MDLISIIIPTFNRAHLIAETIQSVRDQTYKNWELIIVDDGSTDETKTIVGQIADERIRFYKLEHSGIISKVRNTGMQYAKGEYVAFLDSDDIWLPHKLDFQLSLLKKYPHTSFIFGHAEQFGEDAIPPPNLEMIFIGKVFLPQLMEERFVLYPSSFLLKREVINSIGLLDERLSGGESDFFLRMASKYDGIFSGEKLVKLRKHHQNISREREFIFCNENIQMIENFFKEKMLTRKQFISIAAKQHYKLGLLSLQRGSGKVSTKNFLNYILLKPLGYKGWLRLAQSLLMNIK